MNKTFKLVLAAIFCALVFTLTWVCVPAPMVGNINLGDCMIILSACILGGGYAVFAGAAGAALCDLASGYTIYAPATFIIKALMVIVIILMRKYLLRNNNYFSLVISAICAELVMATGYFVYEATFLGYGAGAILNVPFNLIQGAVNIIVAVFLYGVLKKSGIIKSISNSK